jgi:hypothetical protein
MTTPPSESALAEQPAEQRRDYRAFYRITRFLANLTLAGAAFLLWYVAAYWAWDRPITVGIFLLTTTLLAMLLSLVFGLVAFLLFKRRGGKVVKSEPPAGLDSKRRHFSPPPEQK